MSAVIKTTVRTTKVKSTTDGAIATEVTTTEVTTTPAKVKPAKAAVERHYCVWGIPEATTELGIGIYTGAMPAVWQAILKQCKDGCFAGGGVVLKGFASKDEALSKWVSSCPKSRLETMKVRSLVPPVFEFY